jgi:stage II sporulation SpoE-like protein
VRAKIIDFWKSAISTRTSDLLEGVEDSSVRQSGVQFLTMSVLLGAVLIAMRWMHLSSIELLTGSNRVISLGGAIGLEFGWAFVYLVGLATIVWMKPSGIWATRLTAVVVVIEGVIALVRWSVGFDPGPGGNALAAILIVLTLGASLMPWTPRLTLSLSGAWILVATVTLVAVGPDEGVSLAASIFGYITVVVPANMVSFFRTTRVKDQFELRFLQTRYDGIEQELSAAKNIHERAFPQPRTMGQVRFAYSYRPMSQIGGDYLYASVLGESADASVLVVLLDVSGHGIPAALTANRLQGELMQLAGEDQSIEPDELLASLDRYICLTSPEAPVLVTGIAMRVDPKRDELRIANAGHPGALLRDSKGGIVEIDATGPLMGIDPGASMSWGLETMPFKAGDSLIAFTDGITEAMNSEREMFGSDGVRGAIQSGWIESGQRWPDLIRRAVDRYCEGVVKDDMLIVDVYRPQGA